MRYTLVYDSDCGACTRFRNAVEFLDVRKTIGYKGLTEAEDEGLLDPVSLGKRHRSFHLVTPGGIVLSGAEALPALAGLLPGGRLASVALSRCPPAFSVATFAYTAISRLHEADSCRY